MAPIILLIAPICILLVSSVNSARILGIFPVPAKSHFSCNLEIMKSLHAAGHDITMVSPFIEEMKKENFETVVDSRFETLIYVGKSTVKDFVRPLTIQLDLTFDLEIKLCYDVMKLPKIQEALNSAEKLYDVMFIELFTAQECYLPIAETLGIPVIGTVTLHSWKLADRTIGVSNNPAVLPFQYTSFGPEMNFVERVVNLWKNMILDYCYTCKMSKLVEKFHREHFNTSVLGKKEISMIFYNNHPSLLPRAVPPNAIDVGGIHVVPAKPLPKDLQQFIDEASHGVIFFSFGSVVKASSLSLQQRNAFLTAFESIPQRVIWKYEEEIKNLPENILIRDWLPQRDILGMAPDDFLLTLESLADCHAFLLFSPFEHENVIAFISHCGQSGTYEAIVTGTPVVAVPIFCDQPGNAALLHHRGVSVNLDLDTVTEEKVLAALNMIINDTRYYQRMQELSRAFKDRPRTPQEDVVYWTEYVVRHNGTPFLKALGTDMPLYKYFMLDIVALGFLITSVTVFVIYIAIKKCLSVIRYKM